jgi:GAF domain-containing protein
MSRIAHPRPYGVLVAGLSPRRPIDEDYQSYCNLVAGQVATAINTIQTLQEERKRAEALAELDRAKRSSSAISVMNLIHR